jgi:prepilin-type N-terminal cleavage/methylation domain-containing protein/prepilin-type processing-associated H-X9-DG protein
MAQNGRTASVRLRPSGFTLTELLVVVSIICLLMSLLLPSLTHAQKQGEQTHCLVNQHQLMVAWMQYAIDHDDLLCDPQGPSTFTSRLLPYVLMREVLVCKSDSWGGTSSYGISNTMGGQERDGVKPFTKLHLVTRPSERLVLVDKEPGYSTCFWPILRDRDKRWVWRPYSWPASSGLQSMTGRHNNGCNMAFADGHGEYTAWKDDRTRRLIKGRIAEPNEASLDNRDLEYMVSILTRRSDRTVSSTTAEARRHGD